MQILSSQILAGFLAFALSCPSLASGLTLRQKQRQQSNGNSGEWMEAANDFKALLRAITFGEPLPSHHENPLQMVGMMDEEPSALSDDGQLGLFIIAAAGANENEPRFIQKKPSILSNTESRTKPKSKSKSAIFESSKKAEAKRALTSVTSKLSQEDLMLLHLLAAQDEPSPRVKADLKKAHDRYQALVAERRKAKQGKAKGKGKIAIKANSKRPASGPKPAPKTKLDKTKKNGGIMDRLDLKGARNKLTVSVAFAVIVTALFCVVVQLFRLCNRSSSSSGRGFDQLMNRRSGGYERIALDVDEEDEAMPLNAA